jgi:hypothetical protein
MKKLLLLFGLLAVVGGSASALVCDFEGLPTTYYYFYGMQNIGSYYPGVNFGPTVYILDRVIGGYNDGGYPPCSGNAVAVSEGTNYIRADFAQVTNHVTTCYTEGAGAGLWLEAYDAGGTLLASANGPSNYGSSGVLEVNAAGIAYVLIHNSGDMFVIDDFTFNDHPVPAEGETWGSIKSLFR